MSLDAPFKSKARYFKVFKVVEQRGEKYFPISNLCNYYTNDCTYGWDIGETYQAGTVVKMMNAYDLLANGNGWDNKRLGYPPCYHGYKEFDDAHHSQGFLESAQREPALHGSEQPKEKNYRIVRAIFSGSLFVMNPRMHPTGTKLTVAGTKMKITEVLPYEHKEIKGFIWNPIELMKGKPKTDGLPPLIE